jgi:hypothetical protein
MRVRRRRAEHYRAALVGGAALGSHTVESLLRR